MVLSNMWDWIRWLWRTPRTLLSQILALEDTDHSKALGVTVGMFIGMTPTVGIQMILVLLLAVLTSRLFYFNRAAALLTVYVSNPLTTLPIYWLDYQVGTWFVAGDVSRDDFSRILEYHGFAEWWHTVLGLFVTIGTPLILGSLIVASICSLATYPLMRWLLSHLPPMQGASPAEGGPDMADMKVAGREIERAPVSHPPDSQP